MNNVEKDVEKAYLKVLRISIDESDALARFKAERIGGMKLTDKEWEEIKKIKVVDLE